MIRFAAEVLRRAFPAGVRRAAIVLAGLMLSSAAGAPFCPDSIAINRVAAQEADGPLIRTRIDQLRVGGSLTLGQAVVHHSEQLEQLYAVRNHAPIWDEPRLHAGLIRAIAEAERNGLTPSDYALEPILTFRVRTDVPMDAVDLDILRTDALIRLAHDLRHGKVRANDPAAGRDLSRPLVGSSVVADLERVLAAEDLYAELQALLPTHYIYRGLLASLERYRGIESSEGWEPVPAGPTLRHGDRHPRVEPLRRRLRLLGDLPATAPGSGDLYDGPLEAAVRSFQRRHALNPDGIAGPATQRELDVPLSRRLDQVRINLERARWITPGLPSTFVAVNIAGAMAYMVRDDSVVWESRAIVGQTNTSTPIFEATMRTIELNPTWTVPPGIVGEILANVRADANYLSRNDMRVLDSSGRPVSITAAEISRYTARTFPYVFRQEPGPANPLGDIKLLFPNSYNVYLHDTPSRSLFALEERTFSHGCIRLEDPIGLAESVLNDARWTRATLTAEIAKRATRRISLSDPLPVLILYWTAATDETGELHFYRDVYGRDPAVLRALNAPG